MLTRADGKSNDVITLVTRFSIGSFPLRADWGKSDSSFDGEPQGNWRWMEFKFQRRSCKLSFPFPPRRQTAPESLLAGLLVCGKKV